MWELVTWLQPISHERLVTVIDLDEFQAGYVPGDHFQVAENVSFSDIRAKGVPGTPPGRRYREDQPWMILLDAGGQGVEQVSLRLPADEHELLQDPGFTGSQGQPFRVQHDLK